jgi:hypothetical protein
MLYHSWHLGVGEWGFSDSDVREIDEGKLIVTLGIN